MLEKNIRFGILVFLMLLDISITICAISISDGMIFEINPITNYLWGTFGFVFGTILLLVDNIAVLTFFTYVELIPEHKRRPGWPASSEIFFVVILAGYGIIFYDHIVNLLALRS